MLVSEKNVNRVVLNMPGEYVEWQVRHTKRNIVAEGRLLHRNRRVNVRLLFNKRKALMDFTYQTPGDSEYCSYHGLREKIEDDTQEAIITEMVR